MTVVRSVLVALLLLALAPAAALAAPPPNDARAAATTIAALPSTQSGTTAEATTEPVEPRSPCFCNAGSVWYRYVAATNGRLILTLTAAGDLDATLDAYLQQRSQLTREDSDVTDAKGGASVSVRVRAGQAYLVRVAQRVGSVAGTFKLVFDAAAPEVSPPGRLLGRHGASGHAGPRAQARRRLLLPDARRHDVPHQLHRPRPARRRPRRPAGVPCGPRRLRARHARLRRRPGARPGLRLLHPLHAGSRRERALPAARAGALVRPRPPALPPADRTRRRQRHGARPAADQPRARPRARCAARAWIASTSIASR